MGVAGVGEGRRPHNGQTWRGTERETDLATDKKTLEDLEIAEETETNWDAVGDRTMATQT